MIGKLIWKDVRENFVNSMIFGGVILALSIYGLAKNIKNAQGLSALSFMIITFSFIIISAYAIYRGFSSIKREKDKNTLEFLLSLPVDGWEIVISKFLAFGVEALFLSICAFFFSGCPLFVLRFTNSIGPAELVSGIKMIFHIVFYFFPIFLFVFVVFQFYEILLISLKTKNFFVNAILFFLYVYVLSVFQDFARKVFGFLPGERASFQTIEGEIVKVTGTDYRGLAAGALVTVALIVCGILLFNKKVEV